MVLRRAAQRPRSAARAGAGHPPDACPRSRGPLRDRLVALGDPLATAGDRHCAGERGSQAVEFAMALPLVALALALVLCAGVVGMEMVHVHGVAREAARAAAVGTDADADAVARAAAGGRQLTLRLDPPQGRRVAGDLVTAEVGMSSHVLARFGVDAVLRGSATMRAEDP